MAMAGPSSNGSGGQGDDAVLRAHMEDFLSGLTDEELKAVIRATTSHTIAAENLKGILLTRRNSNVCKHSYMSVKKDD